MKTLVSVTLLLLLAVCSGCVSRTQARAQARAEAQRAYAAGRMEALQRLQQAQGPAVTVLGQVQYPMIPWEEGLTLIQAIVRANYLPAQDPLSIVIVRQNRAIPVDPNRLLSGEDVPVEPGDIVQIEP